MMRPRLAAAILLAALATLVSFWLDPVVFREIAWPDLDRRDWGRMLRVTGSLFFWLPLTLALWLETRRRDPKRARSRWMILAGATLAGTVAEILKLLIRRERPLLHDGEYVYRPFSDRLLDSHDLGFPSSHVMVAFGGAAALARQFPRAGIIGYLLAGGCALTRLLAQAHFLSDVVAAALAGWAVSTWLGRRIPPPASIA